MPTDLLLLLSGVAAGAFGALLGLGGGILIVPILTLGFGLPLSAAVGTSLVSVIATSTGAAAVNVRAGRADVRLGLTLGAGTVVGALTGGIVAGLLPERVLAGSFAVLLVYTALTMLRGIRARGDEETTETVDPAVPDGPEAPAYRSRRVPLAIGGAFLAGNVSGLLGIGGGVVTVPLVHLLMGAPIRIAARNACSSSWTSGWFWQFVPSRFHRNGAASRRSTSTPTRANPSIASAMATNTSGFV